MPKVDKKHTTHYACEERIKAEGVDVQCCGCGEKCKWCSKGEDMVTVTDLKPKVKKITQDKTMEQIIIDEVVRDLTSVSCRTKSQTRNLINSLVERVLERQKKVVLLILTNEIASCHIIGLSTSTLTRVYNLINEV